jgi:hypothetical protein
MSTYWSLHCIECNEDAGDSTKSGDESLAGLLDIWPRIDALLKEAEQNNYWWLEIVTLIGDYIWFLQAHEGHSVIVQSEYGDALEPSKAKV